jgi:hypothetical protein
VSLATTLLERWPRPVIIGHGTGRTERIRQVPEGRKTVVFRNSNLRGSRYKRDEGSLTVAPVYR